MNIVSITVNSHWFVFNFNWRQSRIHTLTLGQPESLSYFINWLSKSESVDVTKTWIQERRIQKEEVFVTAYDWGFIR